MPPFSLTPVGATLTPWKESGPPAGSSRGHPQVVTSIAGGTVDLAGPIVLLHETLSQDRRCCSATRGASQTSLIPTPADSPPVAARPRRFSEHANRDSSTYSGKSTGLPAYR